MINHCKNIVDMIEQNDCVEDGEADSCVALIQQNSLNPLKPLRPIQFNSGYKLLCTYTHKHKMLLQTLLTVTVSIILEGDHVGLWSNN